MTAETPTVQQADFRSERITLTVPFHDCDPMGIVWHGNYFKYFELARTQLFAGSGLDVPDIGKLGFRMYVADTRCRYTHPLWYGDEVEVTAKPTIGSPLLRITYSVRNVTRNRRCARGRTVLATTDHDGVLLSETPSVVLDRLRA